MKRAKTKFAKQYPKYKDGSKFMDFLSKENNNETSNAQIIGSGFDVLGTVFGAGGNRGIDSEHTNPWSVNAAENYNKVVAKNQRTKKQLSTGLSTAGDIAMLMPGIGTAIGLGLKGLGAAANFIPFGKGKEKDAFEYYKGVSSRGARNQALSEGAMSFNRMPKYQAPAYGRKGLKFKTKFSKK